MQHFSQRGFVESLHANRSETEEEWADCSEAKNNSRHYLRDLFFSRTVMSMKPRTPMPSGKNRYIGD